MGNGAVALAAALKHSMGYRQVTGVTHQSASEDMLGFLGLRVRRDESLCVVNDPRRTLSDFFRSGDQNGPRGCIRDRFFDREQVSDHERTDWFAVVRPVSSEAISMMGSGLVVGKGLGIKGKSAKQGTYKGMVPFLQISINAHKAQIKQPDPRARIRIFYLSDAHRKLMRPCFEGDRDIVDVDGYDGVYGLDLLEAVMYQVYITSADIEIKWAADTGRKSEPDFQDMNAAALRSTGGGEPTTVLIQANLKDPEDPHGLMLAYSLDAEERVKPVVSDFDLFLVGSRNMPYEALSQEQSELQHWSLDSAEKILNKKTSGSWTTRWFEVVRTAAEEGRYPRTPQFGFGDATSYRVTERLAAATSESGAIRHGAESYNFFFPQELDDKYLVIWEGFGAGNNQWEYLNEADLRLWLSERIRDDYTFPINPIWPIRDIGWKELYDQMKASEFGVRRFESCFPDPAVRAKIERLMRDYPDGFTGGLDEPGDGALDVDAKELANLAMEDLVALLASLNRGSSDGGAVFCLMPTSVQGGGCSV